MRPALFEPRRFSWVSVAMLVVASAPALAQTPPSKYLLRVKGDGVNLRVRPDVESQIVHQVNANQVLEAVALEGGWHRLLPPPGTFGLVSAAYVTMNGPNTGTVSTSTGNLRVRTGSTFQEVDPLITEVIAFLERDATVTVLGKQGDFYKIVPPAGVFFYVSQDFVEPITEDAARALAANGVIPAAIPDATASEANDDSTSDASDVTAAEPASQPGLPPIQPATPAATAGIQPPPRRGLDEQSLSRDAEAIPLATSTGQMEEADDSPPAVTPPAATAAPAATPNAAPMTAAPSTPQPAAQTPPPPSPSPAVEPARPAVIAPPPERTPGPPAGIVPPGGGRASGSIRSTPGAPPTMNGRPVPPPAASPLSPPPAEPTQPPAEPVVSSPASSTGSLPPASPGVTGSSGGATQIPDAGAQTFSLPTQTPAAGVAHAHRNLVTARGIIRPSNRVPIGENGLRYGLFDPYTRRASVYVEFPTALGLNVGELLNRYAIVEGEAYADATTRAPVIRVEYITITNTTPGRPRP